MLALMDIQQNHVLNRSESFFKLLFGSTMNYYPSRVRNSVVDSSYAQNRQWIFVGEKESMKSVATVSSLLGIISDPNKSTTYYTPNGYYRRDQRLTESLRWLNAFVLDIDSTNESLADVMDRVADAGLPLPTAVIRTPSGGYHVSYFFSEPVRATPKTIRLYTAIMSFMSQDMGADHAAVGANRIFRIPTEDNLLYFNESNRFDFEIFKGWREINHPYQKSTSEDYKIVKGNIMSTPALQHILNSPCNEGERELTCFNLALAMKSSNWPIEKAIDSLTEWYYTYCSSITKKIGKKSLSLRDVIYKVKYVYRKEKLKGPSAEMIRNLSGMSFYYAAYKHYEGPKSREVRDRSHYTEWKEDVLALLVKEIKITGSQKVLANLVSCPLSTFKLVLDMLVEEGLITVVTTRGRAGKTTIELVSVTKEPEKTTPIPSIIKDIPTHITEIFYVDFTEKKLIDRLSISQGYDPPT